MLKRILGFIALSMLLTDSYALSAMHVASGQATIQQTSNGIVINQTSQLLLLNANDFNIAANEKVQINQPANGIVLIRINSGKEASKIYGQLTSTSRVLLVNHAGIVFEKSAEVHIGGIIATTSDILNKNFLAKKFTFDQPSRYAAAVVNHGTIQAADHGIVALLGTAVENS